MHPTEPIPANIRIDGLPSPLLPVAQFLLFPLPAQLSDLPQNDTADTDFGSFAPPDCQDIMNTIKRLPIPSPGLLSKILFSDARQTWMSVRYAHLPSSQSLETYPLWLITYWESVSQLLSTVRRPWLSAEAFLCRAQHHWKSPDVRQLCDAANLTLLQLPWAGITTGFGADTEPLHSFAHYLSSAWFESSHIDQQLHILHLDLKRAGILDCQLLTPFNFVLLTQMYRQRETTPYWENGSRKDIKGMGEEFASGRRMRMAGIANINGNHWVGMVIDMASSTIRYGDSLAGPNAVEVTDTIIWWLRHHIPSLTFTCEGLPITPQNDGFSCGPLALNAIRHAVLPESPLIVPASSIAIWQARLSMFLDVTKLEAESVRVLSATTGLDLTSIISASPRSFYQGIHQFSAPCMQEAVWNFN